jgi:hypothetical protein
MLLLNKSLTISHHIIVIKPPVPSPFPPNPKCTRRTKNRALIKQHREVEGRSKAAGISYENPTRGESELVGKGKKVVWLLDDNLVKGRKESVNKVENMAENRKHTIMMGVVMVW